MSTLKSTFAKFFGPSEDEEAGTATRVDEHGILRDVIVDEKKHKAFVAKIEAKADAERIERKKLDELMRRLNE